MSTTASTDHIRTCARCGLRYDWRRSPSSSLKMTYCGSLCERGALGFTIEALLHAHSAPAPGPAVAGTRPVDLPWLIAA